jgi:hypothetical protein
MKRYIRASKPDKEIIYHRFDIVVFYELLTKSAEVVATTYQFDADLFPKELLEDTMLNYEAFLNSVRSLIRSRGFKEIKDSETSPYSDSEYFFFCLENDYVKCEVEVFGCLRVSDHKLPVKNPKFDAEQAQEDHYTEELNSEYLKLNALLEEKYVQEELDAEEENREMDMSKVEYIPARMTYTLINKNKYTTIGESLGKVDKSLRKLKQEVQDLTNTIRENRKSADDTES